MPNNTAKKKKPETVAHEDVEPAPRGLQLVYSRVAGRLPMAASSTGFSSKAEALQHLETRRLMRVAFYDGLGRRPPTEISHMPSYVRAVQKVWDLRFKNSARRLLAQIEGFDTWEVMMRST